MRENRGFLSLIALLVTAAVIIYVVIVTAKGAFQTKINEGGATPRDLIESAEHARDLIQNRY